MLAFCLWVSVFPFPRRQPVLFVSNAGVVYSAQARTRVCKPFFFQGQQIWAYLRLLTILRPSVWDTFFFFYFFFLSRSWTVRFILKEKKCNMPPTLLGFGNTWQMTLNEFFLLLLMGLTLRHPLFVQIDSRNLSLPVSQWQRGCAVLILYLAGCTGHKAFALHYRCWQSRAKKMDDLFVVLPPIHFMRSLTQPRFLPRACPYRPASA